MSGVLATVTAGWYLGTRADGLIQPASRISGTMFWRTVVFLLESALFVLLGLELRSILGNLSGAGSVPRLCERHDAAKGLLTWFLPTVIPITSSRPRPPSPWIPGPGAGRPTDGHGQNGEERLQRPQARTQPP